LSVLLSQSPLVQSSMKEVMDLGPLPWTVAAVGDYNYERTSAAGAGEDGEPARVGAPPMTTPVIIAASINTLAVAAVAAAPTQSQSSESDQDTKGPSLKADTNL